MVHVASYLTVDVNNLLQLGLYEVVEGLDMLLDKTLYFEKSRQQVPFVLTPSQSCTGLSRMVEYTLAVLIGSFTDFP